MHEVARIHEWLNTVKGSDKASGTCKGECPIVHDDGVDLGHDGTGTGDETDKAEKGREGGARRHESTGHSAVRRRGGSTSARTAQSA